MFVDGGGPAGQASSEITRWGFPWSSLDVWWRRGCGAPSHGFVFLLLQLMLGLVQRTYQSTLPPGGWSGLRASQASGGLGGWATTDGDL